MTVVTIERIAAGGDGVGRLSDGLTIFVPRTAPGDVADVYLRERKRKYARGLMRSLQDPGPGRVQPECPHYTRDRCGGCQLQHLSIDAQREVKRRIVGEAVRRIAHRKQDDPPIVPSAVAWRYRRKITLAASEGRIGLHAHDQPDRVFDLEDCPITRGRLMALWSRLDRHRDLLPERLTSLVLREDREGGRHVIAEASQERPWDAAPMARAVGEPDVSYWWRPPGGAARVVAGRGSAFPILTFEQVNPEFGARIRQDALEALGETEGRVAWDLYAGEGGAAVALAMQGADVWAVESDRSAVEWGERAHEARRAEKAPWTDIHWVRARVEEALHRLPAPDVVIANPPRAGLHRAVAARLERWARGRSGGRLAYVSCDPATLARDLARMPSLALAGLVAYDLFPQTSHVETLAVLEAG